jgi:hypothetical protein
MIQGLVYKLAFSVSRRASAILLVALLNLALVPCTMALEVIEEGHDCCPPKLELELPECCELDDISVDKRDGLLELWDSPESDDLTAGSLYSQVARASDREYTASDPPDPPDRAEDRHKILCIFLI